METMRDSWNRETAGKPMQKLWRKLNKLKPILIGLSRRLSSGAHKIQEYRNNLELAQHNLNGDIFNTKYIQEFKHWTEEILKSTKMEERIMIYYRFQED